jgi:hypothetical protein
MLSFWGLAIKLCDEKGRFEGAFAAVGEYGLDMAFVVGDLQGSE